MHPSFNPPTSRSASLLPIEWVKQHGFAEAPVQRTGPRNAAIYCRQSAFDLRPVSIERQTAISTDYISKIGAVFDAAEHLYIDRHRSGATMDGREGLASALRSSKQGAITDLVVEAIDRLGRDVSDLCQIFLELQARGVEIHAATYGPVSLRDIVMLGSMAQIERSNLIEKSVKGTRSAAAKGLLIGRCKMYGYDRTPDGRSLTINRKESDIIRRAAVLVAGGTSTYSVAKQFNADEIPSPGGGAWSNSCFFPAKERHRGIFGNPLLKGLYVWGDGRHRVEIAVPKLAILDAQQFDQLHAMHLSRRRPQMQRGETKRFLSGVLKCSCGAPMLTVGNELHRGSYRCADLVRRGTCDAAVSTSVRIAEVDRRVLQILRNEILDPAQLGRWQTVREREVARRRRSVAARRERVKKKVAELEAAIELQHREIDVQFEFKSSAERALIEHDYGKLCEELSKLVDPPRPKPVDQDEAIFLRGAIDALLIRLPFSLTKAHDRAVGLRLRELMPRVVIRRHPDKSFTLDCLVGISEMPPGVARRIDAASDRWISRTFPPPGLSLRRTPEVRRHFHELAATGALDLSDREWMALKGIFKPFERTKLGAREHANALIFVATSRLPEDCLPDRYRVGTINRALLKKHGIWRRMLRILEKIDAPLLAGLDRTRFALAMPTKCLERLPKSDPR